MTDVSSSLSRGVAAPPRRIVALTARRVRVLFLPPALVIATWALNARAQEHPLLAGYLDYPAITERVQKIANMPHVQYRSLGTTRGGYEIHQVTVADEDADSRPAILIIGGIDATRPVSAEMAIRLAEGLAGESELLKRVTFYIIPQANPDGCSRAFRSPYRSSEGNARPTDDDRDGTVGEDPPEDLDGDGYITSLRVYRTGGAYRPDDKDARVDVRVSPGDEKPGEYDLYTEGTDNDQDESWNEDPGDGVDFNRNFTFQYRPFTRQAGPHPVSEIESRAIADFAWDHPNIAMVICLGPPDNLSKAWTSGPSREQSRLITSVNRADVPYFARLSMAFSEAVKLHDDPAATGPDGDLLHWSYYHFGRWSLGTPSWVIPRSEQGTQAKGEDDTASSASEVAVDANSVMPTTERAAETRENEGSDQRSAERSSRAGPARSRRSEERGPPERRGRPGFGRRRAPPDGQDPQSRTASPEDLARDRRSLQWMDEEKIPGFSSWTRIDHPDFPDKRVEVGGFRPWWRSNPPAAQLDEIAAAHQKFVLEICRLLPSLAVDSVKTESLGNGVLRVTARIANTGYLPTSTHHGTDTRLTYPVQVEIQLPESVQLISPPRRRRSAIIEGGGAAVEHTWLIRSPDPPAGTIKVRASSIMAGQAESVVVLKGGS
jgi:hypothetical protein